VELLLTVAAELRDVPSAELSAVHGALSAARAALSAA